MVITVLSERNSSEDYRYNIHSGNRRRKRDNLSHVTTPYTANDDKNDSIVPRRDWTHSSPYSSSFLDILAFL